MTFVVVVVVVVLCRADGPISMKFFRRYAHCTITCRLWKHVGNRNRK